MTTEKTQPRRVELTERDLETLRWIGEQYIVRLDQLRRLLGRQPGAETSEPGMLSESAARVWRSRMKARGLIAEEKYYHAQPPYIWLTGVGLREAGLDFKAGQPAYSQWEHLYQCSQVRLFIEERRPGDTWRSERYLRREKAREDQERRLQDPGAGATGSKKRVEVDVPDAEIQTANGIIAVEVELSAKDAPRLLAIVKLRSKRYYTTWYFVSAKTKNLVQTAVDKLEKEGRQRMMLYDLPS